MPARILIVDDEPVVRNLIRDTLKGRGYELGFAGNGVEALEELEARSYDLLLTDVVMPEMEGFELLKRAKKRDPALRVVILTGFSREHDISEFLLYGADEYLTKPFQVQQLLATVESVLES
ncbi:MAG: response regulator [Planctomycetota bacterium]